LNHASCAASRYIRQSTGGERFQAFVPAPLPPAPPIAWSPALRRRFDDALVALGRLDAISALLPNAGLLLYSFVRKEAVLSSQIEGTQSSLADLLLFEIDEEPGVPLDDAREVSRCVAALERGLQLVRGGLPVRVIEDCLNGRRTVWDDPFKPGRNGLAGIEQRIEVNSPLA
jgi:hypothetical protein